MLALARKWRPKTFEQVIGQPTVVQALTNAMQSGQIHHAYLLTGTRGVGKTTIGRILAKCLNCETGITATPCGKCDACLEIDQGRFIDLIEVDAASRTKVEDTRELLDNVQYAPSKGRFKVYLIDEVHMLSTHSFNALLKTLEEPPEHIKFILATTDPQKLPATVLSRCLQFHLNNVNQTDCAKHLADILSQENIPFEPEALALIANAARGSMRDALSLLDQCIAYGNAKVTAEATRTMLGCARDEHIIALMDAIVAKDSNQLLNICQTLETHGTNFKQVLTDLLLKLHRITVCQFCADNSLYNDDQQIARYAQQLDKSLVQLYYQILLKNQQDIELAPSPRIGFEMALMRMLAFSSTPISTEAATPLPAAPAAATATATTAKPASNPNPAITSANISFNASSWPSIVDQLPISGMAQAFMQHTSFQSFENNCLTLTLDSKQKPLLNERRRGILQQKLRTFSNNDELTLQFVVGEAENTAHQHKETAKQQAQNEAEQQISADPNVQQILQTFDAEIVEGSIKSSESSSA